MFNFLKKKKEDAKEIELPPPPAPPEELSAKAPRAVEGDLEFPEVKPKLEFPELERKSCEELPGFPEMPEADDEALQQRFPAYGEIEDDKFPEISREDAFGRVLRDEAEKPAEIVRPQEVKQMFVSVEDFKNLAANTNFVRSKLVEADEYLQRLTDLKNQELKAFDTWRKTLESVESKLAYVDKVIAEAQG